jgi:hypothetical protein
MTMTTAQARAGLHLHHVEAPTPKHVENSLRGIRFAAHSPLFNGSDLDSLITLADPRCPVCARRTCRGHLLNTHWEHPMLRDGFHDPLGLLDPHTAVRHMTLPEAMRLEAHTDGHVYRIPTLASSLALCGRLGHIAVVEPKNDERFEEDWPWQLMERVAHTFRTDLRARALRDFPTPGAGLRRVRAARRNDVPAWTI